MPPLEGADIHFVEGYVALYHKEMMKLAKDKNIWLKGGGELVGQLQDRGLLDEITLSITPVILESMYEKIWDLLQQCFGLAVEFRQPKNRNIVS